MSRVATLGSVSQQNIGFHNLVSGLLATFLGAGDAELDGAISEAIRRLVEHLGVDQGILLQRAANPDRLVATHTWTVAGGLPVTDRPEPPPVHWIHQQSLSGEVVALSSLNDLPPDADADRRFLRHVNVRSLVSMPLILAEQAVGSLIFLSQNKQHAWSGETMRRLHLIAEIFGSVLDRHRQKQELEQQLRFESLLAQISARFLNIAASEMDAAVEDAQRLICEQLGLDRSCVYQSCSEGPDVLLLTHLYQPDDGPACEKKPAPNPLGRCYWAVSQTVPAVLQRMEVKPVFPWILEQLQACRTTVIREVNELPEEAAADRAALLHYGTRSTVIVPLMVNGACLGCLTFASMRSPIHWSERQVRRFQFVAGVFASALARRTADQALRVGEDRLQLATDSADVGLWSVEIDSGRIWTSGKARQMFQLNDDVEPSIEAVQTAIHPDDRAAVRRAVEQTIQTRTELYIEHRLLQAGGVTRWVISRGRLHCHSQGEAEYLIGVTLDITERKRAEVELQRTLEELKRLQDQLQQDNLYLRKEAQALLSTRPILGDIVGGSEGLLKVIRQAEQVAATDATVVIYGETGTGKELLAQHIHRISGRSSKPLVIANLAAIPATLLESELFGREKGAYTGALTKEIGRFELAHGGTLFLDEIGEMPLETQVKLLRVLQTGQFERLGGSRTMHVDVRVVAATNKKLPELIKAGHFREDLFYRLHVFPITLPPLRDRREDIPLLVWAFVTELSEKMGRPIERIRKKDMDALQGYNWPGNIRELRNVVERSMILTEGPELRLTLPDSLSSAEHRPSRRLVDVEKEHILEVLSCTHNRVYGTGGAAEILGVKPTTLYSLMARLGIDRHAETTS